MTLPKFTVPVGLADTFTCATALAAGEHELSRPAVSRAVIDTLYVEPVVKRVSRKLTSSFGAGAVVDEATWKKVELGQGEPAGE